jgi:hypothetical protein
MDPLCSPVVSATISDDVLDLGGGPLTVVGSGVLVAKLDPSGAHVWSRTFGDGNGGVGGPVVAYGQGNTLVSGTFLGEIDFGAGPLTNTGGANLFVANLLLP